MFGHESVEFFFDGIVKSLVCLELIGIKELGVELEPLLINLRDEWHRPLYECQPELLIVDSMSMESKKIWDGFLPFLSLLLGYSFVPPVSGTFFVVHWSVSFHELY